MEADDRKRAKLNRLEIVKSKTPDDLRASTVEGLCQAFRASRHTDRQLWILYLGKLSRVHAQKRFKQTIHW